MADNNKTMIRRGISTVAEVETAVNEKAREEYVDAQDTATIEAAKTYTDMQIATRETPDGAQDKADAALVAAKEYADDREESLRSDFAQGDTDTLATAAAALLEAITTLKGDASADYDTLKKLQTKIEAINEAISGTATPDTIDTLNEALSFIREHQGEIESLVNTYVKKEAIANDLTTDDATQVLSAAQGVELKALIDAVTASLAGYVEKANGERLISDAEAEKLAGIEAGANAYTLPAATASSLGGVKAGDNVTIAEDGTLSATAAPYELPKASSTVLGGIKVGNNLSIREDGILDAEAGGGIATVSPDAGNALEQRENGLYVPAGSDGGEVSDGRIRVSGVFDADGNIVSGEGFTLNKIEGAPMFILKFPTIGERPYVVTANSLLKSTDAGGTTGLGMVLVIAHMGLDAASGVPVYDAESCMLIFQPMGGEGDNGGYFAFEAVTLFPEADAPVMAEATPAKIHIGGVVNADGTIAAGDGFTVEKSGNVYLIAHPFGSESFTIRVTPICGSAMPVLVMPVVLGNYPTEATISIIMQPLNGDDGSCKFAFEAESVNTIASGSAGVSQAEFEALKTKVTGIETTAATKTEVSAVQTTVTAIQSQIGSIGTALDVINGEEV